MSPLTAKMTRIKMASAERTRIPTRNSEKLACLRCAIKCLQNYLLGIGLIGPIGPIGLITCPVSPIGPMSPIPRSALIVEKLANVRVARIAHLLIAPAEYDVSIFQHDEFGIYQAQPVAFVL